MLVACDRGRSTREVAMRFDVSEWWVRRIKQEHWELNKTAPLPAMAGAQRASERWPAFPTGHWKTTTFLAALRTTGLTVPLVVNADINGVVPQLGATPLGADSGT